jgi:hypothetical protein
MTSLLPSELPPPFPPNVGASVHYVSRGSLDGKFPPTCRAATVTEVDPIDPNRVGLCVINPSGLFFYPLADGGCVREQTGERTVEGKPAPPTGGTWHWAIGDCL